MAVRKACGSVRVQRAVGALDVVRNQSVADAGVLVSAKGAIASVQLDHQYS